MTVNLQGQRVPNQDRLHPHQHLRGGGLHEDGRLQVSKSVVLLYERKLKQFPSTLLPLLLGKVANQS